MVEEFMKLTATEALMIENQLAALLKNYIIRYEAETETHDCSSSAFMQTGTRYSRTKTLFSLFFHNKCSFFS